MNMTDILHKYTISVIYLEQEAFTPMKIWTGWTIAWRFSWSNTSNIQM